MIPKIIEAGFDCLQLLEFKANMDLIELKNNMEKIAFMGVVVARVIGDPDPEKIREKIKNKFKVVKIYGSYFIILIIQYLIM